MNIFTEHSTLIIIMLLVIVAGTFVLLLGWAACIAGAKADRQSEKIIQKYLQEKAEKELLELNDKPNIKEYWNEKKNRRNTI